MIAGTLAPPPDVETEIALETMNNVFGGTFGARLNMNLREEKHWSYGAASVLYGARAQRPFLAYASVQGDKTADSIAEMLKELNGITGNSRLPRRTGKSKSAADSGVAGFARNHECCWRPVQRPSANGLAVDFYDGFVSRISALTTTELEDHAKQLLQPDNMIWIVVGDRGSLEEPLRQLGIGEIVAATE